MQQHLSMKIRGTYPTDPETLLPVEPNNPDPVVPVVDPTIGPNEKLF